MHFCTYLMIGHYFDKRRALATGLASCGSGIGTFIFAPLSTFLIHTYAWKGGVLILAGVVLNGMVYAMIFRPFVTQTTEEAVDNGEKKLLDVSLLKNTSFLLFCMSSFFCLIGEP